MGVFTDFLSTCETIGTEGIGRSIRHQIEAVSALLDDPESEASGEAADEVQIIHQFATNPAAPATYTLNFNLYGGVSFSTEAIAFDANAATIEGAIDTAATGVVDDWTNGDISVTGGPLSAGDVTLTFDGASVAGKGHAQTTITSNAAAFAETPVDQTTPGVDGVSDEVQTIAQFVNVPTGGTWTLTLNLQGEEPITTAGIAFDANAAAIEAAIDAAVTAAAYAGWTNGDITVAAETTDLTDGDITLTFDGDSVDVLLHDLSEVSGAGLTLLDPLDDPAESVDTQGTTGTRTAWSVLEFCGIVGGTVPEEGEDADAIEDAGGFLHNPYRLGDEAIKAIALQAARDDGNDDVYYQILDTLGIDE